MATSRFNTVEVLWMTRRCLPAVRDLLIAGTQHADHGTKQLDATPGGFGGAIVAIAEPYAYTSTGKRM